MTDVELLIAADRPPVRVRLAQQRLLLAARLARHGPAFLVDELKSERETLPDGLGAGLHEDIAWLASAVDRTSWGTTVSELWQHWRQKSTGLEEAC